MLISNTVIRRGGNDSTKENNVARKRNLRQLETEEQRQKRLKNDRDRKRAKRASENPDERSHRLELNRVHIAAVRAMESPEKKRFDWK